MTALKIQQSFSSRKANFPFAHATAKLSTCSRPNLTLSLAKSVGNFSKENDSIASRAKKLA
jgi:hypothetical protein